MSGSVVHDGYPAEVSLIEKFTGLNKYSNGKMSGCTYGDTVGYINGILREKAKNYFVVNSCDKAYVEIMIFDRCGYVKKHYYFTKDGVVSMSKFRDWLRG